MKRFYCSICKKVRRVRKYPLIIDTPHAESPVNRVGVCNWHASNHSTRATSRRETVVVK